MARITPVPLEQVLRAKQPKAPGARVLRRQQFDRDAVELIRAVNETGAAVIQSIEEDPKRYLTGLRKALARAGKDEIMLRRRPARNHIIAWRMRPEDREAQEKRRALELRLEKRPWLRRCPRSGSTTRTGSVGRSSFPSRPKADC
jgi:hypothetical protein